MFILWQLSLVISVFALMVGIAKKSWILLLVSTITFLPIASYFLGAENGWRYVGLMPIFLLIMLTLFIWFMNKNKIVRTM